MSTFLQPDPLLLAFLLLKTTLYLPVLAVLAGLRLAVAQGPARWAAGLALLLAAVGLALRFGPPLLGLTGGPVAQAAYAVNAALDGMAVPMLASAPLVLSAALAGSRWRGIDAAHGALIAALFILWGLAR